MIRRSQVSRNFHFELPNAVEYTPTRHLLMARVGFFPSGVALASANRHFSAYVPVSAASTEQLSVRSPSIEPWTKYLPGFRPLQGAGQVPRPSRSPSQ